ncbi:MAG: TfoX/Sxy family protein [Paracoccaceae bacterium]
MSAPVSAIRNLGPASAKAFARAGIDTAEPLRALGAEAAYRKLLRSGQRPHFIAFYALYLGLQGRPWNDLDAEERSRLREVFDEIVASVQGADGGALEWERQLDALGVVWRED